MCKGLRKVYGDLEAVSGLDLDIPRGNCFGLLGPNGAGKTTTLRMLLGQS
ncbi:MAG: ATP-binding cassette domain-containing protein, partial [Pseudomonadota bacterium]|nr:ATP-binding cassette domain-containing protein [Pseudomonadota bacterium]